MSDTLLLDPTGTSHSQFDQLSWYNLEKNREAFIRSDDYLIDGGATPLCVDTVELEAMSQGLSLARDRLEGLGQQVLAVHQDLFFRYLTELDFLNQSLAAGNEGAAEKISRLMAAWAQFENDYYPVQYDRCGARRLASDTGELSLALARATGTYELTEDQVNKMMRIYLEQSALSLLAKKISGSLEFPETFTVGGKTYFAKDLNDIQKAAIFLSWWQAKQGEDIFGSSHSVTLHSQDGDVSIPVDGFEDSPELNEAFAKYISRLSPEESKKIQDQIFGYAKIADQDEPWLGRLARFTGLQATVFAALFLPRGGKIFEDILRGPGPDWYRLFSDSQAQSRAEKGQKFAKTVTAKSVGTTRAKRLEERQLGLDPSGDCIANGDGTMTRNLPHELGDTFRYANTQDPQEGGAFEIQQWETASGKKGARVILRGTETWDAGSEQVQDMLTNTESVAGLQTGVEKAVAEALEQLGVSADTPVELVGHSQAGIVASNLAADSGFTKRFNVQTVITAGSPVANAPIPEKIKTLNLENIYDHVPKLDGAINLPSPNHITVYKDYKKGLNPEEVHNRDAVYAEMMDELQSFHYAEVDNFLECRDKVMGFDEEIVKATTQRFEIERNYG